MPIVIYATFKNQLEAKKIASHLLDKRLIACANLFPIKSLYLWKGKTVSDNEVAGFFKATEKNWNKTKTEIKKLHSYEVPCIEKIKIEADMKYSEWIKSTTK